MSWQTIDECSPWPQHPADPAQILRATIDKGMERISDEAADVITDVAFELARTATTAGECDCMHATAPEWIEGAAYAFAVMLGHLQHEMPLPRLRELIEDVADELAPQWEGDDE
jgi:hypothetical protein